MDDCEYSSINIIVYATFIKCLLKVIFFFNNTATTEIYTFPYTTLFRSLQREELIRPADDYGSLAPRLAEVGGELLVAALDRKSTRLNSSHPSISYAVFCLKKKKD